MATSSLSSIVRRFRAPPRLLLTSSHSSRLQRRVHPLSTTTSLRAESNSNDQKDAQLDREKMNTDANEYAKSGTDDTTSRNEDAAFDPNITSPEGAHEKAGEGNDVNPLNASPANQEISQPTSEEGGGAKKKVSEGGGGRQGGGDASGDKQGGSSP